MNKFEPCIFCEHLRHSMIVEDIIAAHDCRKCKGRGYLRTHETMLCNKCGGSLIPEHADEAHGLVDVNVSGGYCSEHLLDLSNYMFSLCEKRIRAMFDQFVIPPEISDYMHGDKYSYAEDNKTYKEMVWRKNGGELTRLTTEKCNRYSDCENIAEWRVLCSGVLDKLAFCNEHKLSNSTINYDFIPVGVAEGILKFNEASLEKQSEIIEAFVAAYIYPEKITLWRYAPELVCEYFGIAEEMQEDCSMLYAPIFLIDKINNSYIIKHKMVADGYIFILPTTVAHKFYGKELFVDTIDMKFRN